MSEMRTEGWSEREALAFLESALVPLRLAFTGPDSRPRLVSLWYDWREGAFWLATPATAFSARQISENPTCAYEVSTNHPPYRGVRGTGTAVSVADRGQEWLAVLVERYLSERNASLRDSLLQAARSEVAIKIVPTSMFAWDFSSRMNAEPNGN